MNFMFLPLEHKIYIFSPPCNILYEFYVWKRGHKGQFEWKQKSTKMAAILE